MKIMRGAICMHGEFPTINGSPVSLITTFFYYFDSHRTLFFIFLFLSHKMFHLVDRGEVASCRGQ